ncbi:hypothetical protein RhiJN_11950 [Ceratobasidium sp. AG-Ba]|nr:hypothetical protein RhiJN_11950 [Ceratobasidium sp. AG-Ba]QRW12562.1 hypothetical protein RhiLY_11561 [Ceratobasidium sp. AG-Ba]
MGRRALPVIASPAPQDNLPMLAAELVINAVVLELEVGEGTPEQALPHDGDAVGVAALDANSGGTIAPNTGVG